METPPFLHIKHISKSFFSKGNEKNYVLKDLEFTVEENTINCIIGGNGTGKTTLFNILSRLQKSTNKKELINFIGNDLSKVKADALFHLGVTRMFQGIQVYDSLSILDNMLLQANNQNLEKPFQSLFFSNSIKVEECKLKNKGLKIIKDTFGEASLFYQNPYTLAGHLSFGQKRLLSLVALLMVNQNLILLDEPTSGVNPKLVVIIKQIILKLKKEGKTILLIEHNMPFVKSIADKVLFLNNRKIELEGSVTEVLDNKTVIENYLGY